MRLHSNNESIQSGELSIIAILETVLAIILTFYIATYLQTIAWIAISAVIAPVLLLRTEESMRIGLTTFELWTKYINKVERHWILMFLLPASSIVAVVIRIYATSIGVLKHPILSLKSIPKNWSHIVLSVDIFTTPELVAAYEQEGKDEDFKASYFISETIKDFQNGNTWLALLYFLPLIPILYLPPILYRWSVKATSIVYSPLLWIVSTTFRSIPDLQFTLSCHRKSDISRFVVFYSLIIILAFVSKFVLVISLIDFSSWANTSNLAQLVNIYVAPTEIPIWHISAFINAVIAIFLFIFSGEALLRIGRPDSWDESKTISIFRVVTFIRGVLTMYTIACTLYITIQASSHWNLPSLGEKIFPWL